jgi:ceramide glucosyltransferase
VTRQQRDFGGHDGGPLIIIASIGVLMAALGCIYLLAAGILVRRFAQHRAPGLPTPAPGITVMKPLCGAEPWLFENLASFCRQDYPSRMTLVCGVADPNDPAIAVVAELQRAFPDASIELVVDPTSHGPNRKISNLVNMTASIDQPVVIVSDSDVRVERDYLARVAAALAEDGVSGVTCLYWGEADAEPWSQIAALGIDGHFLPGIVVGLALGRAQPCFGSTIAFRRTALDATGGFAAFADRLADDYAIGQALRARGGRVAIPPFAVAHRFAYSHWRDLWTHELRWARTVRSIDPAGYAGSIVMHPFAWSLLALVAGGGTPALAFAFGAIGCRFLLLWSVERAFNLPRHPYWLIPMRDLFSAAIYLASYLGRDIVWRGVRYRIGRNGELSERRTNP